ncbi:Flp family type IVb pilin [Streptomyces sp. URMC 127]|uniref:Flp family type IVb pilin n=1 Tax=Streptomyces sp. URMC 127 TaxID=3423402 RepID=UPI003F1A5A9E
MNDKLLKAAVDTKVHVVEWRDVVIDRMFRRERSKGQTAVEYIGMIVVVVAILAAIVGFTDIGDSIKKKIMKAIDGTDNIGKDSKSGGGQSAKPSN